jgi:hypothetical protein
MTDFTTPKLVVTNVGEAAASVATPTGPFIEIASFKIGSAYGYTPEPTDTDINGDLLYEGEPLTYKYVGNNTLDIVCRIPTQAGPFQFGEVALFLTGGAMFAKAAFATPQIKYSSLGTNVLSTYTFNCLLKLEQSVAVFQVNTNCLPPDIWEVDHWSDVYPPALSANPGIPSILVRELDPKGDSTLIHQASDTHWTVGTNYQSVYKGPCQSGSTTTVVVATSALDSVLSVHELVSSTAKEFVIENSAGYLRAVSTAVLSADETTLTFTFTEAFPTAFSSGNQVWIHTTKDLSKVRLSATSGNLLEKRSDGLYYGTVAPPELQNIYVDAVNGSDSNPGTRAQPLQTLQYALSLGASGIDRNIFLYEQQTHYVDPNNCAVFRGGKWLIQPYGPLSDALPPNPGDSVFMTVAAQAVSPTIQSQPFMQYNEGGLMVQYASALIPDLGAYVQAIDIKFVAGIKVANANPVHRNGSFMDPYASGSWLLRNCEISLPQAESQFGSNFTLVPHNLLQESTLVSGSGKLFTAESRDMSFNFRGGAVGSRTMTVAGVAAFIGNKVASSPTYTNFNTNILPTSSGMLERINVPDPTDYTVPSDRIGYYVTVRCEHDNVGTAYLLVNGVQICFIDIEESPGFPGHSGMYTIPVNPGDRIQITGDYGVIGTDTFSYVWLYPEGVTSWG